MEIKISRYVFLQVTPPGNWFLIEQQNCFLIALWQFGKFLSLSVLLFIYEDFTTYLIEKTDIF